MHLVKVEPKSVASYHAEPLHVDFKKEAEEVFAEVTIQGVFQGRHTLDLSLSDIQGVPSHLSFSKKVKWIFCNQYVPSFQNGSVVFLLNKGLGQKDGDYFFLKTKNRLETPYSEDLEWSYSSSLLQAKKQNFIEEQIFYIKKISDLYVQKQNFLSGAKLLNCAIAILPQLENSSNLREYLFSQLSLIEKQFLESCGVNTPPEKGNSHKEALSNIRMNAVLALNGEVSVRHILGTLTKEFQQILSDLISESLEFLGQPPSKWACIGMGSMSRNEMCPYSDIECAFVIEKDDPEVLAYFRTLSKILEFKMINLGETRFFVFGSQYGSPTPGGFCMDSGGNTPLGMPGLYELIGTPSSLAQFQSLRWIDGSIILPNVMSHVCLIAGDCNLVHDYLEAKQKVQAKPGHLSTKNGEVLAMRLLAGHLREFEPDLSRKKEKETVFDIKRELYRPFQEILSSLAIFYELKADTTFTRIDELKEKNILSSTGAENLKKAIEKVLSLRLEVHLFYKDEKELLCHCEEGKVKDPSLLYIDERHVQLLHEIYQAQLPFHKCASEFYQTKDPKSFNTNDFFDDTPLVRGVAFRSAFQYAKAEEAFQQAVSLNPNDIQALLHLGLMEEEQGKSKEALSRYLKAQEVTQQKHGENHPDLATVYNNMGASYNSLGDYEKSLEYLRKGLDVLPLIVDKSSSTLAFVYNNIGIAYSNLSKYDESLEYHERALSVVSSVLDKDPWKATIHNNIACVYHKLGQFKKAIEYHAKATEIESRVLGKNHINVARSNNNVGCLYLCLGEHEKAIVYLKKTLDVFLQVYGEDHHDVATVYNNMGQMYIELGKYDKAVSHLEKALQIRCKISEENHPGTGVIYVNMGVVYAKLLEPQKALEYYQKGLAISLPILGENHLDVASIYSNIGTSYDSLGEQETALQYHEKGLLIRLSILGENSSDVANSYLNIGCVYDNLGKREKALEYLEKGLKIKIRIFGDTHPDVALVYGNIGRVYNGLGNAKKALENHKKSLHIRLKVFGHVHHDVAASYSDIGISLDNLQKYAEALEYYEKALETNLQVFGENNPLIISNYDAIVNLCSRLRKYEKALEYSQKALQTRLRVHGERNPDVATGYNITGFTYSKTGKFQEAIEQYLIGLKIRQQLYEEAHPDIAVSYHNLGFAYNSLEEVDKALEYHKKGLAVNLQVYGAIHAEVAISYHNIGLTCIKFDQLEKAMECHEKALNIQLQVHEATHPAIATSYYNIGCINSCLKKQELALQHYQSSLKIRSLILSDNDPNMASTYSSIGCAYCDLGEYDKALEYLNRGLKIRQQLYGENHADVATSYLNLCKTYRALGAHEQARPYSRKFLSIVNSLPAHLKGMNKGEHIDDDKIEAPARRVGDINSINNSTPLQEQNPPEIGCCVCCCGLCLVCLLACCYPCLPKIVPGESDPLLSNARPT